MTCVRSSPPPAKWPNDHLCDQWKNMVSVGGVAARGARIAAEGPASTTIIETHNAFVRSPRPKNAAQHAGPGGTSRRMDRAPKMLECGGKRTPAATCCAIGGGLFHAPATSTLTVANISGA